MANDRLQSLYDQFKDQLKDRAKNFVPRPDFAWLIGPRDTKDEPPIEIFYGFREADEEPDSKQPICAKQPAFDGKRVCESSFSPAPFQRALDNNDDENHAAAARIMNCFSNGDFLPFYPRLNSRERGQFNTIFVP